MRLSFVQFAVALVVSTFAGSHGSQCTKEQALASSTEDPEFSKACPSLSANVSDNVYEPLAEGNALTAENLKTIESCKDGTCVAYLTALPERIPDCETGPMNPKSVFQILSKLCTSFGNGNVTEAAANDIVKDIAKNITRWSEFGGLGPQINTTDSNAITASPATAAPPPTATPSSDAAFAVVASVSVLASAAVSSVFV